MDEKRTREQIDPPHLSHSLGDFMPFFYTKQTLLRVGLDRTALGRYREFWVYISSISIFR
uniref:Uncharacterized protein n=1 Tax=Nelumbo nucifera TaxID=4432 RepID=A0A823A052_NELNU|nr:TPA_asm: hypothetical protein HUJ06_018373 [Nelumbo nucifera]